MGCGGAESPHAGSRVLCLLCCAQLHTSRAATPYLHPTPPRRCTGKGLADRDDGAREAMVAAGVAVVDAHGASHAQAMLPLFEGYLEPGAAAGGGDDDEEGRHDLVRVGVVVMLGTLAAHLEQGDDKVGQQGVVAAAVVVVVMGGGGVKASGEG